MSEDLLASLLSVAAEELENLDKNKKSLKETDIFKDESNIPEKTLTRNDSSLLHKGDTDSSDDEENRNHEKRYNQFGRDVKHILQSTSDGYYNQEKSWKPKQSFTSSNTKSSTLTKSVSTVSKNQDVYTDPIFGLRIVKPLISSAVLQDRMVGREAVPFARISKFLQTCDKEKDWVIAGVVASRSPVKTSQKGSQYCIWTLTDLKGEIKTVSLFLFSKAYTELWKTVIGTVIGVLNPNVLEKKDGFKDEACLSIDNPQKVLILGTSKDFGTCKSIKKNGEQCNAIVNLNQCEYCIYHIKQEYQKCSKRSELQANFAGKGLIALRNKVLGKNEVFYAGKSYTAIPAKKSRKLELKDNNRLQSLSGKNKSVTLSSVSKLKSGGNVKKKNAARFDVSPAQRLRDMEILEKLGGHRDLETKNSFSGKQSVTVSSEESKNLAANIIDKLKLKTNVSNATKIKEKVSPVKPSESEGSNSSMTVLNKDNTFGINKNSSRFENEGNTTLNDSSTFNKANVDKKNSPTSVDTALSLVELSKQPKPSFSSFIDLNKPITTKQRDRAKLNAIKFVQEKGGIKKIDPNSTRGSGKKRTLEEFERTDNTPKKTKLSESEFISDRFKRMMEATSNHLDLLECRDDEEKEKYFKKLEIKERMEEKMINTHKVPCKAVRCLKCKYTSFSASDLCKDEKHPLKVFDTVKRFFKCGDCGNRTVSLELIPIKPCTNCGSGKWEKTGMMKDKVVSMNNSLSIRGGEQKFVNSVVADCNINLLVPDND